MERINAPGHLAHLAGDAREKIHATADGLRHWDAKELGEHEYLVIKASEWLREYEGIIERQQIRYDRMKAQRDEARERAATERPNE